MDDINDEEEDRDSFEDGVESSGEDDNQSTTGGIESYDEQDDSDEQNDENDNGYLFMFIKIYVIFVDYKFIKLPTSSYTVKPKLFSFLVSKR